MARRKKARLTLKKKLGEKLDGKSPNGVSAQQFAKLPQEYGLFKMEDSNHELHVFAKHEVAYIRHQEPEGKNVIPEEDYWIGIIQEIRADDSDDVWVRVQWFWSPQEVAEVIKSFYPTICGKYEKLYSDNCDIVSAHCFVGHVNVQRFDERSISQDYIGEDEWFVRYNFSYTGRRITPKVTHIACPLCKVPYTPGVEKTLHFCPRPGCLKFYHQSCLVKHNYVKEPRAHRVLETWPDVDRTASVEDICLSRTSPPRKRQKRDCVTSKESEHNPLAGFPEELVALAGQQIVRGTQGGGVVGNIAPVAAARQLIFKTLRAGGVIPNDWETIINVSASFPQTNILPNCICPNCSSPI